MADATSIDAPLPCARCLGNLFAAINPEADRVLDLDCCYTAGVVCQHYKSLNRPCEAVG